MLNAKNSKIFTVRGYDRFSHKGRIDPMHNTLKIVAVRKSPSMSYPPKIGQ